MDGQEKYFCDNCDCLLKIKETGENEYYCPGCGATYDRGDGE